MTGCYSILFPYTIVLLGMNVQIDRYCSTEHPEKTFVCTKKGCPVKCSSLGAAGLHNLYVHEQKLSSKYETKAIVFNLWPLQLCKESVTLFLQIGGPTSYKA